ncbi:Nif3-like dinuclear metal center hexameric protein [Desmospora activa]|uniref:GTP cyclohydrolase 1 type 2 homolog n=1 Tax=Desmospora activa DSM 45169 TaxID=1121389 RepID=A0A2T4ZB19_9BACL|nr:Nif3-like dinuclear metal center hexameric protein [Desmospora activa]PTM59094.1 putative NIF3 family GTP cyclohydrolase 1 type 2 [Desmospora activa DSM 45169]
MVSIQTLAQKLDQLFRLDIMALDSAFSRFIPMVYDSVGIDWKSRFEPDFTRRFNGLMMRGAEEVGRVFLAVFPSDDVLDRFVAEAEAGDLLFMHHPLLMECGDPRGRWGRGFVPIAEERLNAVAKKQLSVYTCHVPMDLGQRIGTNAAIAATLGVKPDAFFFRQAEGEMGWIGNIDQTDTDHLIRRLEKIFAIPYVDFEGKKRESIKRIAIVAGCGDRVEAMREAEGLGADAYITGEVHCHIDNNYGRHRYREMMAYVPLTAMSLIGVSHAASEYHVMKTQMAEWFQHIGVPYTLLPQRRWWL